jgi:DNA-binding MarR family transcriptional regulator
MPPENVVRHEGEHLYAQPPRTEPGRRLSDAILHFRRADLLQAQQAQRDSGLSNTDLTALRYLVQGARDQRDLSPKDLIGMLGTSSATVTNVVDRLVDQGFVERRNHPSDRRAHYLVPTERGTARVNEVSAGHHAAIVEVINGLSISDAEAAANVLKQLAAALEPANQRVR